MNNVSHIVRKYRQAPWRVQRQWIGLFLLGPVLVAMIAAIYLNVTARAALAGREIQNLDAEIIGNQRTNADLETQLAALTSTEAMQKRAQELGFHPAAPEDLVYVPVAGYVPKQPIDMSTHAQRPAVPVILPEYNESLFDWIARELAASLPAGGRP